MSKIVGLFSWVKGHFFPTRQPWQKRKEQVEILEEYDAKVIAETEIGFAIEFYDDDGGVVEDVLPPDRFLNMPYPIGVGTHFWIVTYREKERPNITLISMWPVAAYWHKSWQKK